MKALRWPAIVAAVVMAASVALTAWYHADGHRAIADAVAQGNRAVLRNLLTGDGPFTPGDYLAAGDGAVRRLQVVAAGLCLVLLLGRFADRAAGRVYDGARRSVDAALGHRRTIGAAGAVLAVCAVAWIATAVLQRFPNSGDEYCYLYQAETFARGRVANAPHPLQEFFGFYHIRQIGPRLFSVFPPGWPALLAAALAAGIPAWLVNPLLGAALLWLAFLVGRRIATERAAATGACVVAMSPFFLFTSASFFAHTWCGVLVLAYAYAGLRALDNQRAAWAAAAGAALGLAMLARNYTAVWAAVPFAVALARRGRFGWKALGACAAAGLPCVLLSLWYTGATMGAPFAQAMGGGFEAYDDRWFPHGWLGRGLEVTGGHLANFMAWTPPALLALYLWTWRGRPAWRGRPFVEFIFPALVLGYFLYVDRGGNAYGPRYYFEAFPFVVLAVTARVSAHDRFADKTPGERWACYLLAASVLACLPLTAWHARAESRVVAERSEPFRLVAERTAGPAIVFLASGAGWTRPMSARDLARNDPDWSNPVMWAHDRGAGDARLLQMYPDRPAWRYVFDRSARTGRLEALVVP